MAPIVARLLLNRGMADPELASRFLYTPFSGLRPPEELPGIGEAADRLFAAVQQKRRVCVYGDYDVDGLSGTAILWQCLHLLGTAVDYYIPHRLSEGYGLNAEALQQIKATGASLVVTVDCGIASVKEAEEAKRLGLELIITDHHEPKERLPGADVIVHPRLAGSHYPFSALSGSGVAFKLAWALCQRASGATKVTPKFREFLLDSVALAALGIIADVVPLLDENRILVHHGLKRLGETESVGLRALLRACGLGDKSPLRATDVGFSLGPRLNAAGRLGCARLVVELFTTDSPSRAADIADFLNLQNENRQQIERRILKEAKEQLATVSLGETHALVLARKDWHSGVIGIVAGRLAELYHRPTLLIALNGDETAAQGSARSIPGFSLHEALAACADGLLSHGGHAAAAGFRIRPDSIDDFRQRFCAYVAQCFPQGLPAPTLDIDAETPLSSLSLDVVKSLAKLEPYGAGNPKPLFLSSPVEIIGTPKRVGKGDRHLAFRVRQHSTTLRAIAFGHGDRLEELLSADGVCSLVFTPTINEFNGWRRVQLEVRDFQAGQRVPLEI
ncbi:MAG: single-stranded-DNA-specific exonuclease RecJ [Gemmatales bacterium]|nr:MAG: single-stranded-DNA-specific exonuclease RecJ [Gemmatales bacterium]